MNARHIPMTAEQYHATKDIGSSMIETFRDSRTLYHGLYVAGTIPRKPPTPAMELGTLVHLRILEPDQFKQKIAPDLPPTAPDGSIWNFYKPTHRDWKAEWIEANCTGKILVDADSRAKIEAMAASVFRHKKAWRILNQVGQAEYPIFSTDHETGLEIKCMVDWWAAVPVDLKTTKDPNPLSFANDCVNYGYYRKFWHYRKIIEDLTGEDTPIVHIAVGSEPPYDVATYDLDDTDEMTRESLGFKQWRRSLLNIAKCHETGDWSNPWAIGVKKLQPPAYAYYQEQYQL